MFVGVNGCACCLKNVCHVFHVYVCMYVIVVNDVPSEMLVPGDMLVVPPSGMDVPCDAVLLSGQAIVNEAMLTGKPHP